MGVAEKVSALSFRVSAETGSTSGLVYRVFLPPWDRVGVVVGHSGIPLGRRPIEAMLSEVAAWAWNSALESVGK
jgi:hypothetical protein